MKKLLLETIGWTGAVLLLAGFALTSYGILEGVSLPYQLINLGGSVLLAAYTYAKKAYANTALNIVWVVISIFAIANIFF